MAHWGPGPFDHDTADLWLDDLPDVGAWGEIAAQLAAVAADGADDAEDAMDALCGAELVALAAGQPRAELPDEVVDASARLGPLPPGLVGQARDVVTLVASPTSALAAAWAEGPDHAAWRQDTADLQARLVAAS